jgi:hypothetical protein
MKKLAVVLLCAAVLAGCGAHRMPPVAPQAVGDLKPEIEDADGGLVGMRPGFSPKMYAVIVLTPLNVSAAEIKDDDDTRLAKDMTAYFQAQLMKKLQAAGIFSKVIDATASVEVPVNEKILRLEGEITKAAAMYGAKDWHADAAGDGELVASDAMNTVIWRKSVTVSISESQRTMPNHDALKAAMTSALCQKLASTLLNGLTEHLSSRR